MCVGGVGGFHTCVGLERDPICFQAKEGGRRKEGLPSFWRKLSLAIYHLSWLSRSEKVWEDSSHSVNACVKHCLYIDQISQALPRREGWRG